VIAVLADTHMPKGRRVLPDACVAALGAAEATIHAGDFSAASVLAELRQLCPVVLGVHCNVDDAALRRQLPEQLTIELGGRTVAVLHDAGPAKGRLRRLRARRRPKR
jgi:uncharacterized protein